MASIFPHWPRHRRARMVEFGPIPVSWFRSDHGSPWSTVALVAIMICNRVTTHAHSLDKFYSLIRKLVFSALNGLGERGWPLARVKQLGDVLQRFFGVQVRLSNFMNRWVVRG